MALKITKQIGTNRGITDSAYLRIGSYQISKLGFLKLHIQLFQNQEDATVAENETPVYKEAFSLDIDGIVTIPLVQKKTRTVKKMVVVEEEQDVKVPVYDENNNLTDESKTEKVMVKTPTEKEVEEEYDVPDLSIIEGKDVFKFGYDALKEKLKTVFGEENIIDC